MKKILIFFLIVLFSGCSLQRMSKDELFKNNQECYKYKKDIEERVKSENEQGEREIIESIFYSPKVNSCLYVKVSIGVNYWKYLYDVMKDEYGGAIDSCFKNKDDSWSSCEEFDERIKNKWKK